MSEDQSDETSENDTTGKPDGSESADLLSAAKDAINGWAELTDTTHSRAFARMTIAIERLCDAIENYESAEAGRVVDAMTPEQVDAYLVSMGVNLDELNAHTEQMRQKLQSRLKSK